MVSRQTVQQGENKPKFKCTNGGHEDESGKASDTLRARHVAKMSILLDRRCLLVTTEPL